MISDERFPKEERLVKAKDFRKVYKKGAFFKKGDFVFYFLPNALGKNRIGFSIPSKNIRLASSRNRIRRLLREAYRKNKKILKKGFDVILVVKKDLAKSITYVNVKDLFLRLAKEANLLI